MTIRDLTRRVALQVPRVREYYEYASGYIDRLVRENADLQAQLTQLRNKREPVELELYVLRSDFQRSVNRLEELRVQLRQAAGEAEHAKQQASDRQRRIGSLEGELAEQRCRRQALEADLAERCNRREALEADLSAQRSRQKAVEAELAEQRSRREVLEADLSAQRSRREALEADLSAQCSRQKSVEADLAEQRSRREVLEADLAAARARREALETEQAEQRTRRQVLEADLAEQHNRRQALEADLSAQRSQVVLDVKSVQPLASAADFEHSHSRLLARLYMLSAELSGLRRLVRGNVDGGSEMIERLRGSYLDLLETALTGRLYDDPSMAPWVQGYNPEVRAIGRDWPARAQTMIGTTRMRNIRVLAEKLIDDGIGGDFLEAGVWRGGACIYMRGILAAYGIYDRRIFAADSFAGLPPPRPELYPADLNDPHHTFKELVVPLEEVKGNFAKYGLLDNQVVFLPGWFKDTLPNAPIEKLALLRLDGDMYESTMETLENLYYRVSPGGFVIVDDYILGPCRQAVDDFRNAFCCGEPLEEIDGAAVYWRKQVQSRRALSRPRGQRTMLLNAPAGADESEISTETRVTGSMQKIRPRRRRGRRPQKQ